MIECMTFRMRGHEEASGTKYVPKELFEEWMQKDPIRNYEEFLVKERLLDVEKIDALRDEMKANIESELQLAYKAERVLKNVDLQIYDKNDDVGGTWLENRE